MKILSMISVLLIAGSSAAQADSVYQTKPEAPPVVNRTLSLADALTLADALSINLAQARYDVAAADASAQANVAQSRLGVSANAYATVGNAMNVIASAPAVAPTNYFVSPSHAGVDANITAMAPISTGGRLSDRIRSMHLATDASHESLNAAILSLNLNVTQAYTQVLLAQATEAAAQQRATSENEQLKVVQAKVDTGALARVDLLREQSELADAQESESDAAAAITVARADLAMAIGLDLRSNLTLTDSLAILTGRPAVTTPPISLAAAIDTALARRPEIRAADKLAQASGASVDEVRDGAHPQVYGFAMTDVLQTNGSTTGSYTAGIAASLPLLDGGERKAEAASATAKWARARADTQVAAQTVTREVIVAWTALQTATAKVEAANAGLAAATEGYDLAVLRFEAGKSTTAERVDSLATLTRARSAQAAAEAATIVAQAQLTAAMGG